MGNRFLRYLQHIYPNHLQDQVIWVNNENRYYDPDNEIGTREVSLQKSFDANLDEYNEYSVEWESSNLVYRLDVKELYRNVREDDRSPEPMFTILNFAKIAHSPMKGEWVVEVNWVKYEYQK